MWLSYGLILVAALRLSDAGGKMGSMKSMGAPVQTMGMGNMEASMSMNNQAAKQTGNSGMAPNNAPVATEQTAAPQAPAAPAPQPQVLPPAADPQPQVLPPQQSDGNDGGNNNPGGDGKGKSAKGAKKLDFSGGPKGKEGKEPRPLPNASGSLPKGGAARLSGGGNLELDTDIKSIAGVASISERIAKAEELIKPIRAAAGKPNGLDLTQIGGKQPPVIPSGKVEAGRPGEFKIPEPIKSEPRKEGATVIEGESARVVAGQSGLDTKANARKQPGGGGLPGGLPAGGSESPEGEGFPNLPNRPQQFGQGVLPSGGVQSSSSKSSTRRRGSRRRPDGSLPEGETEEGEPEDEILGDSGSDGQELPSGSGGNPPAGKLPALPANGGKNGRKPGKGGKSPRNGKPGSGGSPGSEAEEGSEDDETETPEGDSENPDPSSIGSSSNRSGPSGKIGRGTLPGDSSTSTKTGKKSGKRGKFPRRKPGKGGKPGKGKKPSGDSTDGPGQRLPGKSGAFPGAGALEKDIVGDPGNNPDDATINPNGGARPPKGKLGGGIDEEGEDVDEYYEEGDEGAELLPEDSASDRDPSKFPGNNRGPKPPSNKTGGSGGSLADESPEGEAGNPDPASFGGPGSPNVPSNVPGPGRNQLPFDVDENVEDPVYGPNGDDGPPVGPYQGVTCAAVRCAERTRCVETAEGAACVCREGFYRPYSVQGNPKAVCRARHECDC